MARQIEDLIADHGDSLLSHFRAMSPAMLNQRPPGGRQVRALIPEAHATSRECFALARWLRAELGIGEDRVEHLKVAIEAKRKKRKEQGKEPAKIEATSDGEDRMHVSAKGQSLIQSVDELVSEADIDLNTWRVVKHRVNTWTTSQRGPNDKPVIIRHWQVRAELERRQDTAEFIEVQARVLAPPEGREPGPALDAELTLVIPDSQHGYRWNEDRKDLIPLHDEAACDVVLQVVRKLRPARVLLLGDMLDLAEWSTRFPRPADLRDTTRPSLQRLHDWLADIREAVPAAEIVYVEGNHEHRIERALVETASHAAGLRAVGDSLPALSVARLLALDKLGIEYVGPYGVDYWLHGRIRIAHGDRVRPKGGATAQAVLSDAMQTTWFGHVHRLELAQRTVHGPEGSRIITAASPGCLCRVDGTVPGVSSRPDWQQGYGLIYSSGEADYCEVRGITNGRAVLNGVVIVGDDRR